MEMQVKIILFGALYEDLVIENVPSATPLPSKNTV
jgi:hypothetical protein